MISQESDEMVLWFTTDGIVIDRFNQYIDDFNENSSFSMSMTFGCNMYLRRYPHDTQNCSMDFATCERTDVNKLNSAIAIN